MNMSAVLSSALKAEVIHVRADANKNEIAGQFFHKGRIYNYLIKGDSLECSVDEERNRYMAGFYSSFANSLGAKIDSLDPVDYFDYIEGYSRFDGDKCVEGVPCGGRCLPKGYRCRLGDRLKHRVMQLRENKILNAEDESNYLSKQAESKRGKFGQDPRKWVATGGETNLVTAAALNGIKSYNEAYQNERVIRRQEKRREKLARDKERLYAEREALIKSQGQKR